MYLSCHSSVQYEIYPPTEGIVCLLSVPLGKSVNLSNGALKLSFDEAGQLTGWTNQHSGAEYTVQQEFLQEAEKENLNEFNVCDGTNVYTFVPDDGSKVLTPKVNTFCS